MSEDTLLGPRFAAGLAYAVSRKPEDAAALEMAELQEELSVEIGKEREGTTAQQQASVTAVLRRMRAIERDRAEIREARRLERDSISQIEARELAPLDARYAALERWAEMVTELIEWPKRKASHDTPYGTFGVRKTAATVKLEDDEKLLAWAKANRPEEVMTEESVHWGKFKRLLDPNAETLPDGVVKVEATVTPWVKVSV